MFTTRVEINVVAMAMSFTAIASVSNSSSFDMTAFCCFENVSPLSRLVHDFDLPVYLPNSNARPTSSPACPFCPQKNPLAALAV